MKNRLNVFIILFLLVGTSIASYAQIRFKLTQKTDKKTYVVSVVPEKTYNYPNNIISTAQITFKVMSKANFVPGNFTTSNSEERWMKNSVVKSHPLAPQFDYYSYGLETMASTNYKLNAGEETFLFSFETLGDVNLKIQLIDNEDIMAKSVRKTKVNLGNQINILGHGEGLENAYAGNLKTSYINQETGVSDSNELRIQRISPNPASEKIQIDWINNLDEDKTDNLEMIVVEAGTGRTMQTVSLPSSIGKHITELQVSDFSKGMFLLRIQDKNNSSNAEKFILIGK